MDRTQDLVHNSSIIPPRSEDQGSRETSSVYSSPISISGSQGGITPIGLGISHCGIENAFNQLRAFPPTPRLPSQLIPETTTPTFALSYDDYIGDACYSPIYGGLSNSASQTSLGLCSPPTMSASPSYNPAIEIGPGQNSFPGQMTNMWMHTPCSGPTTPSDVAPAIVGNGAAGQWSQSVFSDACIPVMPLLSVCDASYLEAMGRNIGYESSPSQSINTGQILALPQSSAREGAPEETIRSSRSERCSSADKLMSASGLECPVCGTKFTRRSNCKEHQKMHNPEWKNNYRCEDCHKTFGRSSDLKRHRNTVSRLTRKIQQHMLMETRSISVFGSTAAIVATGVSVVRIVWQGKRTVSIEMLFPSSM